MTYVSWKAEALGEDPVERAGGRTAAGAPHEGWVPASTEKTLAFNEECAYLEGSQDLTASV